MGDYLDATHRGVADLLRANREARAKAEADAAAAQAEAARVAAEAEAAKVAAEAPAPEAEKAKVVAFKALSVDDFGVIVGIGGAAGSTNKQDLDGEFVSKGDLMAMAFEFNAKADKAFRLNHDANAPTEAKLVESWVGAPIIKTSKGLRTLNHDEPLTDDMDVVGINTQKGNETHWFIGIKPTDPKLVEAAKAGDIAGFSWAGPCMKTEV